MTEPFLHLDTPLDINLLWHGEVETKLDARSPLSLTLIYDCCRLAANKEMMNRPTKHTPQVQSPLDFATVDLVANLALATSRAVTDLHQYKIATLVLVTSKFVSYSKQEASRQLRLL